MGVGRGTRILDAPSILCIQICSSRSGITFHHATVFVPETILGSPTKRAGRQFLSNLPRTLIRSPLPWWKGPVQIGRYGIVRRHTLDLADVHSPDARGILLQLLLGRALECAAPRISNLRALSVIGQRCGASCALHGPPKRRRFSRTRFSESPLTCLGLNFPLRRLQACP